MRASKLVAFAAAAVFAMSATAACGSSTDTASDAKTTAAAPAATTMAAPTTAAASTADAPFGAGCAAVPTDPTNAGSFTAMAKVPVGTAAAGNPVLTTLVAAAKAAKLVDSLNTLPAGTVFAPTDAAFAKIPKADLDKVLADNKTLTSILTYHVVPEKLTPAQLAGSHKTLQGSELNVTGSGTTFTVNGTSMVICGNVQTANAIVYIVDTVLMPKS